MGAQQFPKNMARILYLLLTYCAFSAGAAESSSRRDEFLQRIERSYIFSNLAAPESPILDLLLSSARQANLSAPPETWSGLKMEFATAIFEADIKRGGPLSEPLRIALKSLSDSEVERVSYILEDPAFKHFQAITSSRTHIQNIIKSVMEFGSSYNSAINSVLLKHGLNPARQN